MSYFAQPVGVVRRRRCQLTRAAESTLTGAKRFKILVRITKVRRNKMKRAKKKKVTPVLYKIWANLFFLSALLVSNWLCCGCLQSACLVSSVPSAACCSGCPKCWHSWLMRTLLFIHTVHTSVFALDQLGFNICPIRLVQSYIYYSTTLDLNLLHFSSSLSSYTISYYQFF